MLSENLGIAPHEERWSPTHDAARALEASLKCHTGTQIAVRPDPVINRVDVPTPQRADRSLDVRRWSRDAETDDRIEILLQHWVPPAGKGQSAAIHISQTEFFDVDDVNTPTSCNWPLPMRTHDEVEAHTTVRPPHGARDLYPRTRLARDETNERSHDNSGWPVRLRLLGRPHFDVGQVLAKHPCVGVSHERRRDHRQRIRPYFR